MVFLWKHLELIIQCIEEQHNWSSLIFLELIVKTTFFSRNLWFLVSCQIYWHKFVLVLSYLYNHCSVYHYVPFTSQTLCICAFLCLSSLRSSFSTFINLFQRASLGCVPLLFPHYFVFHDFCLCYLSPCPSWGPVCCLVSAGHLVY